jgi:glycerol-3-phosphate dehydrogenase
LEKIRQIVQPELGWSDERWEKEAKGYREIWSAYYSPD